MRDFREAEVENAALEWLSNLDWAITNGSDLVSGSSNVERSRYDEVILRTRLQDSLTRLNPGLPELALRDCLNKLTRPEGHSVEVRNRNFHHMLVDGVTVEHRNASGEMTYPRVQVIDYEDPSNNDWLAVNQLTVIENKHKRRPDVVLFVNGLPLAVIELKDPAQRGCDDLDGLAAAPDL